MLVLMRTTMRTHHLQVCIALSSPVDSVGPQVGPHKNGLREEALVVSKARRWSVQDDWGGAWRQGDILPAPIMTWRVKTDFSPANDMDLSNEGCGLGF